MGEGSSTAPDGARAPDLVPRLAFALVAAAVLANLLYNLLMEHWGHAFPYNTFVHAPEDRFGDFFKMAMGYPGPTIHSAASIWHLDQLFPRWTEELERLKGSRFNHFHMLPVSTLLGLGIRGLLPLVEPLLLFLAVAGLAAAALAWTTAREAPAGPGRLFVGLLALGCYPALFAFDRGHLFSVITAVGVIGGTLRSLRMGRADAVAIALFAVAINIRPNAGVVPLALFLAGRGWRFRDMVILGCATAGLFVLGFAAAHAAYPAYTPESWRQGMSDYVGVFIVSGFGQAYNSSLYGALLAMYGPQEWTRIVPLLVGAALFGAVLLAARRRRLPDSALLFVVLAVYATTSQVFADYHLLVFLIPVVLLAREGRMTGESDWPVLLGACFVLAPKNYLFFGVDIPFPWSLQVVLNPLVMVTVSLLVILRAYRGSAPAPRLAPA
ncbi:hypothetical protein ACFQPG_04210 [Sphingomonas sp. GCM10030256]|uniref:hypothetical protein n=1 Tax=Sphingomonas sp. GCM10030256 TaxID=3273427 RepID=UPI003618298B